VKTKTQGEDFQSEDETGFSFTCSKDDIHYWTNGSAPTLLVVCRPPSELYWVCVNEYFADNANTQTVRFDKTRDRLSKDSGAALQKLATAKSTAPYLQATPKKETLTSNLLEIVRLPQVVYSAKSRVESSKDVYEQFTKDKVRGLGEFIIRGSKIITVHNLEGRPWEKICDAKTIQQEKFEDWAKEEKEGRPREVIELLNKCISNMLFDRAGIRWHSVEEFHYFMKPKTRDAQKRPHAGKKRDFLKATVTPHFAPDGKIKYYCHVAFKSGILHFKDKFLFQISPTYHYTRDGTTTTHVAEELRSGIKRMERNNAVKQSLTLIADCILRDQSGDILRKEYPYLQFGPLLKFQVDQGIDDTLWNKAKMKAAQKAGNSDQGALL
jgi:hypothetical protein